LAGKKKDYDERLKGGKDRKSERRPATSVGEKEAKSTALFIPRGAVCSRRKTDKMLKTRKSD